MLKEFVDRILALATVETRDIDGRKYSTGQLNAIKAPLPEIVEVQTLSGLVLLIDNEVESKHLEYDSASAENPFIHVQSFDTVVLCALGSNEWGQRLIAARAKLPKLAGFSFGQFMTPEAFIIGLQSNFVSTPDLEYVLKTVSNLQAQNVATSEDDGVSQTAKVQTGVVLGANVKIKPRVELAPFRTFREVEQPKSEFLFRLRNKGDNSVPECALIEADGGAWQIQAMKTIAEYFAANLPKNDKGEQIPIIA